MKRRYWVLCHEDGTLFCNWHPKAFQDNEHDAYAVYIAYAETPPALEDLDIIVNSTSVSNLCWRPVSRKVSAFDEMLDL